MRHPTFDAVSAASRCCPSTGRGRGLAAPNAQQSSATQRRPAAAHCVYLQSRGHKETARGPVLQHRRYDLLCAAMPVDHHISQRCLITVRCEWPATGVAHGAAYARELLYIPVVINDLPPGRSVISEPHVDEIGCKRARPTVSMAQF